MMDNTHSDFVSAWQHLCRARYSLCYRPSVCPSAVRHTGG